MKVTDAGDAKGISSRRQIVAVCIGLFLFAFAVRVVTWQNNKLEMAGVQYVLTDLYERDAGILLSGDIATFLAGPNPPTDASVLLHPPGYPILIAGVSGIFGSIEGGRGAFQIVQLLLNSLAPVLIFLIARRLFDLRTALIAGILAAVAPQFAYHSAMMLPDELSAMPILLAVYFYVRAIEDRRLTMAVFCGAAIGLSCWFRSNTLLLPVFFALSSIVLLPKPIRVKFALLLMASFIVTISPITIRNYVVFKSFIPLSLGMGTTLVEGLGDYDTDGKLGMPATDEGVMEMDARIAGRPDYRGNLYNPDGVERERERLKIALTVVRENPGWYFTSVLQRGFSTLRFERVPAIAAERDERATTPPVLYYLNVPLKLFQRGFITAVFLPLFILGVVILLSRRGYSKLLMLAIVPLYYFCVQSLIHTEYRYVLATPHLMMIVAAVCLSVGLGKLSQHTLRRSDVEGLTRAQ